MALEEILTILDGAAFTPQTLQFNYPANLSEKLSPSARAFIRIALGNKPLTVSELTSDTWKDDPVALDFFFCCDEDVRIEILTFLTLFVHEYTHQTDFLISPFGLQYYAHTMLEYWQLQDFFPRILDDPQTIVHIKFLAALKENLPERDFERANLKEIWKSLESTIHIFYAWGDVSTIEPLRKYIQTGWGNAGKVSIAWTDDVSLEPVTLLNIFHTFRVPGHNGSWCLRPLAIFETKAIVNSMQFILHMLGERGANACLSYYKKVYLQRKSKMPPDYFFLLDLGAHFYDHNDFESLLKESNSSTISSTLCLLSAVCWYAQQASPHLKDEDSRFANPILRLWIATSFMNDFAHGRLRDNCDNASEALLRIEQSKRAETFFQKPINKIIQDCRKITDNMIELNHKRTWNPEVRRHFHHILTLMKPHFDEHDLSYASLMGMPKEGNPLLGCRNEKDWEVVYDDYKTPDDVKNWFTIRQDLFFNMLKTPDDILERLDAHFLAVLIPHICKCGTITEHWASRFANEVRVTCASCGQRKIYNRKDMTLIRC